MHVAGALQKQCRVPLSMCALIAQSQSAAQILWMLQTLIVL